jgi:(p)ppGpp synthase/HD superfamily hydrolase
MDTKDHLLNVVLRFARDSHGEQKRKYSDEPYISHPIRVMQSCSQYTDSPAVLSAALLHDVLEDTAVNRDQLMMFLKDVMDQGTANSTFRLVDELTDVFIKSSYPQINRKQRKTMEAERLANISPNAQTIKYADIIDNLDVAVHDPDFARVFLRESLRLLKTMDKGNSILRQEALTKLSECFEHLGMKMLHERL